MKRCRLALYCRRASIVHFRTIKTFNGAQVSLVCVRLQRVNPLYGRMRFYWLPHLQYGRLQRSVSRRVFVSLHHTSDFSSNTHRYIIDGEEGDYKILEFVSVLPQTRCKLRFPRLLLGNCWIEPARKHVRVMVIKWQHVLILGRQITTSLSFRCSRSTSASVCGAQSL